MLLSISPSHRSIVDDNTIDCNTFIYVFENLPTLRKSHQNICATT